MELIYISPLRYPAEKAGSQFSMKSCESFADRGWTVELWAPRRKNRLAREDPFIFHGARKNFKIVFLPVPDLSPLKFFYVPMALSFAISVFFYALGRGLKNAVYYSHEEFALFLLTFLRRDTVYEVHDFPASGLFYRWLLGRVRLVVATNNWKKNKLGRQFNFPADRILSIPNAVDADAFAISLGKGEARDKLGLARDKKIILYSGHLFGWKGVDTLFEASRFLNEGELIYFVGGVDKDIGEFKAKSEKLKVKNVVVVGRRPHGEIPIWLRAADVLVLPNTARENISKYYTSPVKLFEYMASGRPIVASDLPSVKALVDERMAVFFEPDNPKDLADKIHWVLENPQDAQNLALLAQEEVLRYTWDKRAGCIIEFIEQNK